MSDPLRTHTTLDTLVWLSEEAFQGDPTHSLLANLHDMHGERMDQPAARRRALRGGYPGACRLVQVDV